MLFFFSRCLGSSSRVCFAAAAQDLIRIRRVELFPPSVNHMTSNLHPRGIIPPVYGEIGGYAPPQLEQKTTSRPKTSRVTRGGPRRRSTTEQASRHWAVYPASMLAITPDGGDWAYRGPESGASVQAGYTQPSQSYHDKYGSAAHYQTESMGAVCAYPRTCQ